MKKILIFEPSSNQALAISKYIKKYTDYEITGVLEQEVRFNSDSYDDVLVTKFLEVDINKYDYVLPMGADSSFRILEKYKILNYCNKCSMRDSNLIVFDKPKMLQVARNIGVPIPVTYYKKDDIEGFPIFYKENFEKGGGIRGIANSLNEIPLYDKLIYQEYIDTPATYGVGFLVKDGKIITYLQHKEVISYPRDGGSAVVVESYDDERLLTYVKQLVKEIDYNGWGLAEFKYCNKRNDFVFMEINAKFWASIEFMLNNNPLFLEYLLEVKYNSKKENSMVFVNRLFQYKFIDLVKNFRYLFANKSIKESSLGYQILRRIVPNKIVDSIKSILR